jgi:hypothetical protein
MRGHVDPIYRLAWSADLRMLTSTGKDVSVKVSICILDICAEDSIQDTTHKIKFSLT